MKQYNIVNENDPNESFTVEAESGAEAAFKALDEIGWMVTEPDTDEVEQEKDATVYPIVNPKEWIGGCLQGYIDISYDELIEKLGDPSEQYDDYKSDAEWQLKFEDGTTATIYNYKTGKNYLGAEGLKTEDIRDWHIGGESKRAVELVYELFGMEVPTN